MGASIVTLLPILISFGISIYCYNLLPILDFRPYKKGNNIIEGMQIPEDAPLDKYETTFFYEKDGIEQAFTLDNYPAEDSTWTFVRQESKLIEQGYVPPIHDFSIVTEDGDITDLILDLRCNGGGSVNSSIMLGSMILPESYIGKTYANLVRNPKNTRLEQREECLILKNGLGDFSTKDLPNLNLEKLWVITRTLQKGFREIGFDIGPAEACVTPVHVKAGVNQATNIAVALREEYHIFCSVVVYPVIPPGMVIFRIIPTAAHSLEDVERTLAAFRDIKERLDRGEFDKEIPNMAMLK
jgi:hypothetical protein